MHSICNCQNSYLYGVIFYGRPGPLHFTPAPGVSSQKNVTLANRPSRKLHRKRYTRPSNLRYADVTPAIHRNCV